MKQVGVLCGIAAVAFSGYRLQAGVSATDPGYSCYAFESGSVESGADSASTRTSANLHREVRIQGDEFTMGTDTGYYEERPARQVTVTDFWIDVHEVTNRQFAAFVQATSYVTTAEREPDPALFPEIPAELLVPGSATFVKPGDRPKGQERHWWKFVNGASWHQPHGPGSSIDGLENYPVVHISYEDANAYATWAGRTIPSEAQWELAAQASAKLQKANTWQGYFPMQDSALDGFHGIAPVGCYQADESGLFDMKGNVWELVSDHFEIGGATGDGLNANPEIVMVNSTMAASSLRPMRVIKGGSYLCSDNFCQRDRPQSRQGQEEDFSTDHVGFRTISLH